LTKKIFQRQLRKKEVSDSVVDERANVQRKFSVKNLKALFTFNENTQCETYDALMRSKVKEKKVEDEEKEGTKTHKRIKINGEEWKEKPINFLDQDWDFIHDVTTVQDPILSTVPEGIVSFVFTRKTEATEEAKQLDRMKDQELLMKDPGNNDDDDEEACLE